MVTKNLLLTALFFDIESATKTETLDELTPEMKDEWIHKCNTKYKKLQEDGLSVEDIYFEKGALELDFARIVTISCGLFTGGLKKKIMSVSGDNEEELLIKFSNALIKTNKDILAGANILEYDIILLCRAYLRNGIAIPRKLKEIITSKPWDLDKCASDLCKLWAMGSYGNRFNRFNLICLSLGVDSPKNDISGPEVSSKYYAGELDRIVKYCEKDVSSVMDCYLKIYEIHE